MNILCRNIKEWFYRRNRKKIYKKKIEELNKRDNFTYKH